MLETTTQTEAIRPEARAKRVRTALIVCVSAFVLVTATGCGVAEDGVDSSARPIPAAEQGDEEPASVPESFEERTRLPSCGEIELGQGESIPDTAIECLEAASVEGAELVVSAPTVEGDPIVQYFRALPGGGAEVYKDATADKFAGTGRGWHLMQCPQVRFAFDPAANSCTTLQL